MEKVIKFDKPTKQVTLNKDSNLIPENIKEGVSIEGISGTFTGGENVIKSNWTIPSYDYDLRHQYSYYNILSKEKQINIFDFFGLPSTFYDIDGLKIKNKLIYFNNLNNIDDGAFLSLKLNTAGHLQMIVEFPNYIWYYPDYSPDYSFSFQPLQPIYMRAERYEDTAEIGNDIIDSVSRTSSGTTNYFGIPTTPFLTQQLTVYIDKLMYDTIKELYVLTKVTLTLVSNNPTDSIELKITLEGERV